MTSHVCELMSKDKDANRPLQNLDWEDPPVKLSIAKAKEAQGQTVKVLYANKKAKDSTTDKKAQVAQAQMGNSANKPPKSDPRKVKPKPTYSAISYFVGGSFRIPFLGSNNDSPSSCRADSRDTDTVESGVQTSGTILAAAEETHRAKQQLSISQPMVTEIPPSTSTRVSFDDDSEIQVVPFTQESSEAFDIPPPRPRQKSIRTKSMVHNDTPMPKSNANVETTTVTTDEPEVMMPEALTRPVSPEMRTLNMENVRSLSVSSFRSSVVEGMKVGVNGLREYVDRRQSQMLPQSKSQWDFIDHFAAKDGYKYVLILEKYYGQYRAIYDGLMKHATDRQQKAKVDLANQLLHQIAPVEGQKKYLEYDFPGTVEKICSKLQVNLTGKISALRKMHDYGSQMIHHWSRRLDSRSRPVLTGDVYEVTTEIMADIMVICFAIFAKLAEYIHKLIEGTAKKQYTLEHFCTTLRNLLGAIFDEHGALSDACGLVIVRIPKLSKDDVVQAMTKIFTQVNFADMSASRGIEALGPLLQVYNLHYFILKDRSEIDKR